MNELRVTVAGQAFTFAPGQTVRIGRSPENSVIISDPIVSRDHARVIWRDGGWVLDDLGKGRTFVGGMAVGSVAVQQPLEVHLATPLGPRLRIELTAGAAPPGGEPVPGVRQRAAAAEAAGGPAGPAANASATMAATPAAMAGVASRSAGTMSAAGATGRPASGDVPGQAPPGLAPASAARPSSFSAASPGSPPASPASSALPAQPAAPESPAVTPPADSADWGDLSDLALQPDYARQAERLAQLSQPGPRGSEASSGRVRHASAVHREQLWRGDVSASHTSPVYSQLPAHHAKLESPGGDFATAVHILVPIRSWLKDTGWKQGSRLLVIAYGLLPSLFVVLFSATTDKSAPGWAYSLAIAPLWAVAFWLLIRPGHITKLIGWLAVGIVAAVMVLLPTVTLPWEDALDKTSSAHNLLPWIYGVGIGEEVTKALPILVAALLLRWVWKITLDVRIWMFLGTIAGLAFGVRESVFYTSSYLTQGSHKAGLAIPLILSFAQRVFVDGFQHAVWAGIAAFFIGIGVNYRRRRIPLILFGILLPAVLHGLNDWSTELASHWLWIVMEAISLLLFIGYTMSAATIERQVRDTPLFRGDSMIMDKAAYPGQPAGRAGRS